MQENMQEKQIDSQKLIISNDVSKFNLLFITAEKNNFYDIINLFDDISAALFSVEYACSFEEAERLINTSNFDLVFIDLNINSASPQDFIKTTTSVSIIILAGSDNEALESELFEIGAQEYLNTSKINAQGLWRAMRHAYGRHKSQMELERGHEALYNLATAMREGNLDKFNIDIDKKVLGRNAELFEQIKLQNEKLEELAHFDSLTEVPNRRSFEKSLNSLLGHSHRHQHKFALLMIDLDGFKKVNDTLGHQAGDELLKIVAKRFASRLRKGDILARVGGDEFAVLLSEIKSEHGAGIAAKKLLNVISYPVQIGDETVKVGASIGVACYPESAKTAEDLLQNADLAMYSSKEQGGMSYQYSSKEAHNQHIYRLRLEEDLSLAIKNRELHLNYQPIVDLRTGKMDAMEVLVRWSHPRHGNVSPEEFIPIAEEAGLIVPLGQWVFQAACEDFIKWRSTIGCPYQLGINISPHQLKDDNFIKMVNDTLDGSSIHYHSIDLEITEMAIMMEGSNASAILNELHKLGGKTSMDDFGMGYSSLSRLKSLPISTLKIDRSFIDGIGKDTDDEVIINSIIALADQLGLGIVAEGIEEKVHVDYLLSRGCQRGQGFYYSKPLSFEAMTQMIKKNGCPSKV